MSRRKLSSTNLANEQQLGQNCPFNLVLSLLGKRWKPAIVWKLTPGPARFGQLQQQLSPISAKILAGHLRELEEDGLLERQVFAERPVRIEYHLTARGRSLEPMLKQLHTWGEKELLGAGATAAGE